MSWVRAAAVTAAAALAVPVVVVGVWLVRWPSPAPEPNRGGPGGFGLPITRFGHTDLRTTHYVAQRTTYPVETAATALAETEAGMGGDVLDLSLVAGGPRDRGQRLAATAVGRTADDAFRLTWEIAVAQGAVAERLAGDTTDLADVLSDSDAHLVLPDGSRTRLEGGAGDITAGQVFAAQRRAETDAQIESSVEQALTGFDLTVTSVRVLRPLGPAVAVTVSVADPETLRGQWASLNAALLGSPYNYEGVYLELTDADGAPLAQTGVSFRSGAGSVSFAPGMDELLGIAHGGTPARLTTQERRRAR